MPLLLLAVACGPSGEPGAWLDEAEGLVELPRELAAAFTEDAEAEPGEGRGWLLLTAEPLDCEEVAAMPGAPLDADHLLFRATGLAFELVYETVDDLSTFLAWEGTYWAGATDPPAANPLDGAVSPLGWRAVAPWLLAGGEAYPLEAGWVRLDRHDEQEVEGAFAVTGYAGEFLATHCGPWSR